MDFDVEKHPAQQCLQALEIYRAGLAQVFTPGTNHELVDLVLLGRLGHHGAVRFAQPNNHLLK